MVFFFFFLEKIKMNLWENNNLKLSFEIGELLKKKLLKLVTIESCTGGSIASLITSIPGSSEWFDRGFITYSLDSKQELVGVKKSTLDEFGAVSKETVIEMANGGLEKSKAQISISVSGFAGPLGGNDKFPVGTVWFCLNYKNQNIKTFCKLFNGNRNEIQIFAVIFILTELKNFLMEI